jgi:NAD(P)-dependent dehydrogenase (short-subunit alcohol dehydrogenase family)
VNFDGAVAVVTGAGGGIGSALGERFHAAGATVVVSDRAEAALAALAARLNVVRPGSAHALVADLSREDENARLVHEARRLAGRIDLFFANAGVAMGGDLSATEDEWMTSFAVNVHAHRWAAKHLLPEWLAAGGGYFASTASAAGVLAQIGSAPYSVSKHAAVAFAEWLSITYGSRGVKVSCLCPQGVNTAMLRGGDQPAASNQPNGGNVVRAVGAVLEPAQVANVVHDALVEERFFIFPHPEVADYLKVKAVEHERWLGGMRKLQRRVFGV